MTERALTDTALLTCGRKERNRLTRSNRTYRFDGSLEHVPSSFMKYNIWITEIGLTGVTSIGAEAFLECTALKAVDLSGIEVIGEKAFSRCRRIRKLTFPEKLRTVRPGAFRLCTQLRSAAFDRECRLTTLGDEVFADCESLKEVVFPRGLKRIGRETFSRCKALKRIELPLGLVSIGSKAFYNCALEELELPEGLREIGESAFLKCRNLTYVYIPDTVTKIGKWAFHGCDRLKVLEIDHDPEVIGEWITNRSCAICCPKGSRMEAAAIKCGMPVIYREERP